ncbi:MAG: glycosyltransferase family 1 protein [Candidatus Magasanikiibacteriota bacterium]
MNVGIDIRCLMDKNRTGVGEYTFGLLDNLFKGIDSTNFKKDYTDNKNQFFLFYNSSKDILANLPKWGYENVHYIGLNWPNKLLNLLLWLRLIRLDKMVAKVLKDQKINLRPELRSRERSKDQINNVTIRQCNNLNIWFSPNLNFTNLSKGVKHIQTIHDLSFEFFPECFTWKQRLWHWFLNPKKQCKRADIILTPSENTRRDVVDRYHISDNKIQVLRPGLSVDRGHKTEDIRHKYGLPEKYILYLGTLEPRKNVESIVDAYKLYRSQITDHYPLVLAGALGWKNKKLMQLIKNTPNVKYSGYVDGEDKMVLYKNASLFVFPSLYEGFGLPVLEAMSCGVPVITSNRSSLTEVGQDAVYYVNPNNVNELAGAMELIMKNNELRTRMIARGLEVGKDFDWQKSAQELLSVINNVS